jgi:alpha/beta superfamily hydrolase
MPGPRHRQAIASVAVLAVVLGVAAASCVKTAPNVPETTASPVPSTPYLARRHAHDTSLRVRGPSPGKYAEYRPPSAVAAVTYPSGELSLSAWYATPLGAGSSSRAPALVYFHGDFAFGPDDFEAVRPYVDAGFVVMTPMLRGENGNPGDFELLWGEIDDARAAIEWIAAQPVVDRNRIYAFGHSIGGGVAAMLSLYPTLPLRISGSCGGIYMPQTFARWAASPQNGELVRFDAEDPDETELRVLGPNLAWMVHRHIAYVGDADPWFVDNAAALERSAWALGKPFERVMVTGDHMASLQPALEAFLQVAQADRPL